MTYEFRVDAEKKSNYRNRVWYQRNLLKVLEAAKEKRARDIDVTISLAKRLIEALEEKVSKPVEVPLREVVPYEDDSLMTPIEPEVTDILYKSTEKGSTERYMKMRNKKSPEDNSLQFEELDQRRIVDERRGGYPRGMMTRNLRDERSHRFVMGKSHSKPADTLHDSHGCDPSSKPSLSLGSEWSEHISSSGKRYYYNSVSEVSQWEKPRDWDSRRSREVARHHERRPNSRSRREAEKYGNRRTGGPSDRYWGSNSRDGDRQDRARSKHSSSTYDDTHSLQDMDISPNRSAYVDNYRGRGMNSTRNNSESSSVPPVVVIDNSNYHTGSLLAAALPRINPAHADNGGSPSSDTCTGPSGGSTDTPRRDTGPPTPTHSEDTHVHVHTESALPRKVESLGSYSSVVGGSALHSTSMLTPSLVNYVRADLTTHTTGWPADILEKQAKRYMDEAYQLGCLQCTRVSAELKCARSVVRVAEIQATLQEQKIMYLRQQMDNLENMHKIK